MIRGLDVSYWQIKMDWEKSKQEDVAFGAVRCTIGGGGVDQSFDKMYNRGVDAGLIMMPYHLVLPDTPAEKQMNHFFEYFTTTANKTSKYMVLDCELDKGQDKRTITSCIQKCVKLIGEEGYTPIIYTAKGWWDNYVLNWTGWKDYPLWVANYPYDQGTSQFHSFEDFELYLADGTRFPRIPKDWDDWQIWQFSSQGAGSL